MNKIGMVTGAIAAVCLFSSVPVGATLAQTAKQAPAKKGASGNWTPSKKAAGKKATGKKSAADAASQQAAPRKATKAPRLTKENVNKAAADGTMPIGRQSPLTLKLQIYLDRAHFSPGVLDAIAGENVLKALKAFQRANGLTPHGKLDPETWKALQRAAKGPVLVDYTITKKDLSEPLVARIPKDYAEKAEMKRMAYTSYAEMLAERFHMDIDLLKQLNFTADLTKAGTVITVAAPGPPLRKKRVARIDVDKATGALTARDETGRVIAFYPATVGSRQLPSPAGTHTVKVVAINPTYTYRPGVNFKQGDNDKPLTVPAGPNGPVGAIWIGLSRPTYGIHGTPDPAKIDKSNSHGCVRLTNWDAHELAHLVKKGTVVEFSE